MEWYDNFTSKDLLNLTNNNKEAADIIYMWYDNESAADDFESKADYIDFISDDIYNMLDSANTEEQQIVKSAIEKLKNSIRYRYYRYYLYIWSDSKKTSQIGSAKIFDYFKDAVNFAKTNNSNHPKYYYTIQPINQITTLAQSMSKDEFFKHTRFESHEDIWNSIDGILVDNSILNLNKLLAGDKDELSKENTINNADDAVATLKRSVRGNFKESFNKIYQITVKYHNEPNAKIEARSAKDRKDLEYQLNMDNEVEWYDFDEEQFIGESFEEIAENTLENNYNINERVASSSSFVELEGFKRDWKDLGLNDDDLRDLQNLIINNPSSSIPLGSNVYKIRFSPERLNKGKDTANRVIYIEVIKSNVIYLATAFSKSEEANISKKEEDTLRAFANILNR